MFWDFVQCCTRDLFTPMSTVFKPWLLFLPPICPFTPLNLPRLPFIGLLLPQPIVVAMLWDCMPRKTCVILLSLSFWNVDPIRMMVCKRVVTVVLIFSYLCSSERFSWQILSRASVRASWLLALRFDGLRQSHNITLPRLFLFLTSYVLLCARH